MLRLITASVAVLTVIALPGVSSPANIIGDLQGGGHFAGFQSANGWGLEVIGDGSSSVDQPAPVQFEFYLSPGNIQQNRAATKDLRSRTAEPPALRMCLVREDRTLMLWITGR